MRLPSESKQQLFLKNLFQENCLLNSGLGMALSVMATVNTEQAFFVSSLAMLAMICNSLASSILSDVFRLRLPLWARVMATALLVCLLLSVFAPKLALLPPMTAIALMLISVSPLTYARSLAFADGSTPGRSLFDAAGAGAGLVAAMLAVAAVREALGAGTLGALRLFASPPLPALSHVLGGLLVTAAAVSLFRLAKFRAEK